MVATDFEGDGDGDGFGAGVALVLDEAGEVARGRDFVVDVERGEVEGFAVEEAADDRDVVADGGDSELDSPGCGPMSSRFCSDTSSTASPLSASAGSTGAA